MPGPSESHFSKLFDIHMMCWGNGQERTEEEYASLLKASGWRFVACHYPWHANMGVVEGRGSLDPFSFLGSVQVFA